MITVTLFKENGLISGFEINGHSGYSESGKDVVCASVSSVAYFVANTLTDIMNAKCDVVSVSDGNMKICVNKSDLKLSENLLNGFRIHMLQLSEQYSDYIKVIGG